MKINLAEMAKRLSEQKYDRKDFLPENYSELRQILTLTELPPRGLNSTELEHAAEVLGYSTFEKTPEEVFAELKAWQKEKNISVTEEN